MADSARPPGERPGAAGVPLGAPLDPPAGTPPDPPGGPPPDPPGGPPAAGPRRRLGEVLVDGGTLTAAQLEEALAVQRGEQGSRRKLGEVIAALGYADDVQIARALSDSLRLPFVDLGIMYIPETTLRVLPRHVAVRHQVVPIALTHDVLTVAMADPTNVLALDDIRLATRISQVRACVATASDLTEAVEKHYGLGDKTDGIADSFGKLDIHSLDEDQLAGEEEPDPAATDNAPVVRLVNAIMAEAMHSRASDIHIEPQARELRIRFRIDGLLREITTVPKAVQGSLISRVKILSGMDISERRKPQDGRGRIHLERQQADTRVSTMPTLHGETVVIRLLRKEAERAKDLSEIGMADGDRAVFEQALAEPQGLVLVTGPTGSGKTSTLYAGLNHVLRPDINVITLEDPVEYQMDGVNQMQVHEKIGLTFASGLRTVLRQDPDVVMVGEIRDPETAAIAMQASMTGHLVLSTLHSNDAASSVSRLIDMGVEPYLITSSLTLVIGQRLARVPCRRCAVPVAPDARTLALLGLDPDQVDGAELRSGPGCNHCAETGFQGRVGVYELLSVTRSMRELLAERAPESAIRAAALAEGMRTLRQDALAKALAGQTTLEEVLRITPADRSRRAPATAAAPAPQPAARRPAADGTAAHHKASTDRAARAWPGAPAADAPAQPGMR